VTLFEPAELHALLSLPDGVETLGWLCVGWPDERPPAPGLERHGWSRRLPLAGVVLRDRWPAAEPPAPPPDRSQSPAADRKPGSPAPGVRTPGPPGSVAPDPSDSPASGPPGFPAPSPPGSAAPSPPGSPGPGVPGGARVRARDAEDRLLAAPGSLGLLGEALIRVESVGGPDLPGTLVIAAADHRVADLGVSAFPQSTTRLVAQALAAGAGQGAALARAAGLDVYLADCGIDGDRVPGWHDVRAAGRRGDLASADALAPGAARQLIAAGRRAGAELAGAGPVLLGEAGIGNTTVAAALAAALLAVPAGQVVGRGAGSDTSMVARKRQVVEQALARMGARLPPAGPLSRRVTEDVISGIGGPEQAFLTGVCLGAAEAGGLVILDGLLTSVSALAAVRHRAEVQAHLIAGQLSAEPAHSQVLDALGLEPLLDLRLRAGEGAGAVLARTLIAQATAARRLTATTS
jgi:nicotinate-nucleotide--dimethylbenzimidazole phosphoribosyltransferase